MTKNINIDLKARGSHFALAYVFRDALPLLVFLLVCAPLFAFGLWCFNNLQASVSKENEFHRLVAECTSAQYELYGKYDSYSCRRAVNAKYRVYAD